MLNEVVITANRSESRIFSIPATISSVNSKYIESHLSRTTPEILMGTAGVFVQKTNHGGGSPFVRGLTGNQTLLLVDGIRLNNSTFRYGPNQYFNTIDPFSISRIEVLKGEGSVAYGSDALGGTIQVFTKITFLLVFIGIFMVAWVRKTSNKLVVPKSLMALKMQHLWLILLKETLEICREERILESKIARDMESKWEILSRYLKSKRPADLVPSIF